MSNADVETAMQPADRSNVRITDAEDEGNRSSDTRQGWNGDPMDWKSWPTGRPGPVVSEARMQVAMKKFQDINEMYGERSRATERVFHVAEFFSSGQGEFNVRSSRP